MSGSSDSRSVDALYVGVDGGGSGCRLVLADADLSVLHVATGGPANPYTGSADAAWASVEGALLSALAACGLVGVDRRRIRVCLGLAGVDRPKERDALLAAAQGFGSIVLVPDVHAALVGAHGREQGAVLVAGTGSVAYAIAAGGETLRVGGWGPKVGDEGGGAWIGTEAVRAVLWALDGRGPATALREAVNAMWGTDVNELLDKLKRASPADIARLAPTVLELAAAGDAVALTIQRNAVTALLRHAEALDSKHPLGPVRFSIVGSIGRALIEQLRLALPERLRDGYAEPLEPPHFGALHLGYLRSAENAG